MSPEGADVHEICLCGDLTFVSVPQVSVVFLTQVTDTKAKRIHVDASTLKTVDSAGLALLVEGVCLAQRHGKTLHYLGFTQSLLDFAEFSGLTQFLGTSVGQLKTSSTAGAGIP